MVHTSLSRTIILLSVLGGALFPLGFSPIAMPGMAFLSIGLLYILLNQASANSAFTIGLFFGIGKYTVGVSWVYVCIASFSNAPGIIAALVTLCFIVFLALYEALFAWMYRLVFRNAIHPIKILSFALMATLFEWLRSTLFTGFPWLLFSHSLIDTPLSSLLPITGTYGLGCIAYCLTALLATGFLMNKKSYLCIFAASFLLAAPLSSISWTRPYGKPLKTSLIQGNVSRDKKWIRNHFDNIIDRYATLTKTHWDSDLIVWPETAIPMPSDFIEYLLDTIEQEAITNHSNLLIGIPYNIDAQHITNAMMLLGKTRMQYNKQHLVPFGEYFPLPILHPLLRYFHIPLSSLTQGKANQAPIIVRNAVIAPFICFDIVFSQLLYHHLPDAKLLVTISDDSWYGHSFAKAQHLQIARVRSVESGRSQLFATNNGLTAVIDHKGNIIKALPDEKEAVLTTMVSLRQGNTPWGRMGDLPVIITCLILLIATCLYPRRTE